MALAFRADRYDLGWFYLIGIRSSGITTSEDSPRLEHNALIQSESNDVVIPLVA